MSHTASNSLLPTHNSAENYPGQTEMSKKFKIDNSILVCELLNQNLGFSLRRRAEVLVTKNRVDGGVGEFLFE